jgi:hypothetical protein
MKCARCGKDNPAEVHTCTPLALKLAEKLDAEVKRTVSLDILHNDAAIELQRLHAENEALRSTITKLHKAKGRYHTQLAVCDLFDLVGLPNERPKK